VEKLIKKENRRDNPWLSHFGLPDDNPLSASGVSVGRAGLRQDDRRKMVEGDLFRLDDVNKMIILN
jgi:hypothetical protein